jgi:hypothetical protein
MGNSSSVQLDGEQGSVSVRNQALDMSIQGSSKSWATIVSRFYLYTLSQFVVLSQQVKAAALSRCICQSS